MLRITAVSGRPTKKAIVETKRASINKREWKTFSTANNLGDGPPKLLKVKDQGEGFKSSAINVELIRSFMEYCETHPSIQDPNKPTRRAG